MMGLSFVTPLFLVGAFTLVIPIIIHLTNREKRDVVAFPSLMFLRKIPYRSVRRQKIRHWLLFMMRCLALLLLVISFARPFLESPGRAVASLAGARELVVLIDRSYSMGYEDRWVRALDAAHRIVDGVKPRERATVVFFSDRATATHQPTSERAKLHSIIDGASLGSGTTRYAPALKLAKKLLEESKLPKKEVALITDFQRLGWEGNEEVWLPDGTELTTVDLSDQETSNLAVTTVVLERERVSGRERVVASARLINKGAEAARDVRVQLELNARPLREKRITLGPNSSATLTFEPFTLPEGISRGTVRAASDSLPHDNAFHFVLWPGQSLSVLVLEGPGVRARRSLYLRRVLAVSDRPSFQVEVKKSASLGRDDLPGRSVVFWNDAPPPDQTAGRRLRSFVESGGGLVVALGEGSGGREWKGEAADLLPASWSDALDRSADWGGTLAYLDYDHPVFELFGAPRSGDFSSAKFFRYRPLAPDLQRGILARFDDGAVALAEKAVGEGKVLVWTSTLDTFWNDLALQPVFLPFIHQLVKHAAGYTEAASWHAVGEVLDLSRHLELAKASAPAGAAGATSASSRRAGDSPTVAELVAVAPSGEKVYLSRQEDRRLLTLEEQGFYNLRYVDGHSAGPSALAVNLDLRESDLSSLDPEEVAAAVSSRESAGTEPLGGGWTPEEQERRQRVWWYLLVAALLLLAVETVFSNRLSRIAR
jgi:hypothetical protein